MMMSVTSHQEMEVNNNETLITEKQQVKDVQLDSDLITSSSSESRTITVTDPEQWLCVAKLPPDTTEESFHHLLSEFGSVKESLLVCSTKTGECYLGD